MFKYFKKDFWKEFVDEYGNVLKNSVNTSSTPKPKTSKKSNIQYNKPPQFNNSDLEPNVVVTPTNKKSNSNVKSKKLLKSTNNKSKKVIQTKLSSKKKTLKVGKTVKLGACIFPFKYKGEIYNECYKGKDGEWCATEVNPEGKMKKYAFCDYGSN